MKHEHFKSFLKGELSELNSFMNGNITAKSISIGSGIITIGYVNSKAEHHYKLVKEKLENIHAEDHTIDLSLLDKALETAAAKHKGVVCQHINIEVGDFYVVFLVAE